jgi:hypothetical protein
MLGTFTSSIISIFSMLGKMNLDLPWLDLFGGVNKIGQQLVQKVYQGEMYTVLEYDSTLELHDCKGQRATYRKHQKVRYLQDNIIAFEDQAWGDGEILVGYKCSPGVPVDQYRLDYKTFILISLREVRNKGDIDDFNIEWGIRGGFLRPTEQWGTEIRRPISKLKVSVIFPKKRPPQRMVVIEKSRQRRFGLGKNAKQQLPDGRWRVTWKKNNPRRSETYLLEWKW